MTLDEAIRRAEEAAEDNEELAMMYYKGTTKYIGYGNKCKVLAEDHRQLAEWLKELKAFREAEREMLDGAFKDMCELEVMTSKDYEELDFVQPHEKVSVTLDLKPCDDAAERKIGHWIQIYRNDKGVIDAQCSECESIYRFIDGHMAQYKYCPSCRAKMIGGIQMI